MRRANAGCPMCTWAIGCAAARRWITRRASVRLRPLAPRAGCACRFRRFRIKASSVAAEARFPFRDLLVGTFRTENVGSPDRLAAFELIEFLCHGIRRERHGAAAACDRLDGFMN